MKVGEIYRIYSRHIDTYAQANVKILEIDEKMVKVQRLEDGEIIWADRRFFEEDLRKELLIQADESQAYGNDCPKGVCEW